MGGVYVICWGECRRHTEGGGELCRLCCVIIYGGIGGETASRKYFLGGGGRGRDYFSREEGVWAVRGPATRKR